MKITKKWLEGKEACQEGMAFVEEKELIGLEGTEFVKKLMDYEQYGYANWLIVRIMDRKQCVKYAQFAADSAKKYAGSAARAAECAASATSAERAARAYWAKRAAECAEWAAECAESAAYWAKRAADCAESADAYKKIINFGLKLLEGVE